MFSYFYTLKAHVSLVLSKYIYSGQQIWTYYTVKTNLLIYGKKTGNNILGFKILTVKYRNFINLGFTVLT